MTLQSGRTRPELGGKALTENLAEWLALNATVEASGRGTAFARFCLAPGREASLNDRFGCPFSGDVASPASAMFAKDKYRLTFGSKGFHDP
jgi:hypothetical protein